MRDDFDSSDLDLPLADRLLAGEATPDDQARFATWVQAHPADRSFGTLVQAAATRRAKPTIAAAMADADVVQGWRTVAAQLPESVNAAPVRRTIPASASPRLGLFGWRRTGVIGLGVAAMAIAALVIPRVWSARTTGERSAPSMVRDYATQRAQRATIQLPDGSHVILGPDTRVRYTETRDGARAVTLTGQAYFTVVHDPTRTFVVQTRWATTSVLGTAFSVRSYDDDRVTQVAVAEGKVAVRNGGHGAGANANANASTSTNADVPPVVLLAGDAGMMVPDVGFQPARDARVSDVFGWTRGQFVYRDVPFRDVVADLQRIYDIEVRITDPVLAARRVTIELRDEPAADMLRALAPAIDATYRRTGRIVELSAR